MNFCVQDAGGGQYMYTFTLTLDNHDGSWSPGQGFGWIIFGDAQYPGPSQLDPFTGDPSSLPIGPWTSYGGSGGGHNGPTLSPVVVIQPPDYPPNLWVPAAVGDSLTWRGTSATLVPADQMQWSNLMAGNGAGYANWENMTNVCGPTGACCMATGCQVLPADVCAAAGGSYNGDGSHCSSCPAVGACCNGSGCSAITEAACASSGGSWLGAGSTCPQSNYVFGNSGGTFIDISGTGTDVTSQVNSCDDGGTSVSLPFSFSFYGSSFNSVWFCTNGFLQFGGTNRTDYGNLNPPSAADPGNAIYACWDDLFLCNVGNMYYRIDGTAPNRSAIFSWQGVAKYSDPSNGSQTFQAILYEGSNSVELRYRGMSPDAGGGGGPGGGDYTIGVENQGRTAAVTILGSDIGSGNTARMLTFVPASCGPSCDSADFNCDGDTGTDADIEAFFRCIAGTCPQAPCTNSADFNHDGDTGTDADIESFFRVLAGSPC